MSVATTQHDAFNFASTSTASLFPNDFSSENAQSKPAQTTVAALSVVSGSVTHNAFNLVGNLARPLFPNDFSSQTVLSKFAEAEVAEALRKKIIADEATELERLRRENPILVADRSHLEAQSKILEAEKNELAARRSGLATQLTNLETQKSTVESEKTLLISQISSLEGQNSTLRIQKGQRDVEVANLESKIADVEQKAKALGRLDPWFHERDVHITQASWPHNAIDFGDDDCPYGTDYHDNWEWQWVRLRMVAPQDIESPWLILCLNKGGENYLGLNERTEVERQSGRRWDSDTKKRQEWNIKVNKLKTGYTIDSVPHGWLEFNGSKLSHVHQRNVDNRDQDFHIIPMR